MAFCHPWTLAADRPGENRTPHLQAEVSKASTAWSEDSGGLPHQSKETPGLGAVALEWESAEEEHHEYIDVQVYKDQGEGDGQDCSQSIGD